MQINSIIEGSYRIRQAGAKSDIANLISNGKKCVYVQIGSELTKFDSVDDAKEFVAGKDLVADSLSLDFGEKPADPDDKDDVAETA